MPPRAPIEQQWPAARLPRGRIAYVNGRYVPHGRACVHIEDRGLQFADSVYEVFGIRQGRLQDEEEHLDRLERSTREIDLALPIGRSALKFVLREVCTRNRVKDGLLYLQVTRGAAHRDHPIPDHPMRSTLILTAHSLDQSAIEARRELGIAVVTAPDERWARCDIKSTQLLANLLAKTSARRSGAYEALLVDSKDFVTEGASTTAWIVDAKNRIVTRRLSHAVLPGVTRRVILGAVAEAQLSVVERPFTRQEALAAREAFISSATGIYPVISIDGEAIGDGKAGPITRRVQELYARRAVGAATDQPD